MRHIDLFSGLGGFAYAAMQVWGEEYECLGFVENDRYCQELLKRRFPNVQIWGDIKDFRGGGKCDLITGGFPCQPFSCAGKRKGTKDDRCLWDEMYRVICECSPLYIIAENVRGLLTIEQGMVFQKVLSDLESAGYKSEVFIIPACAVNAPHRRDRVWIVAHRKGRGNASGEPKGGKDFSGGSEEGGGDVTNTGDKGLERGQQVEGLGHGQQPGGNRENEAQGIPGNPDWGRNWVEVATELCGVDAGLPAELDGFKLSKSRHRVERLKALGNAIVPQVAMEIMKAIKAVDISEEHERG